jgi:hypothetical protein
MHKTREMLFDDIARLEFEIDRYRDTVSVIQDRSDFNRSRAESAESALKRANDTIECLCKLIASKVS